MGIWAEIKYALNSTLGTSGFKSLDKLISDKISEKPIVKSVQRGTANFSINDGLAINVNISAVNPSKCSVNVATSVPSSLKTYQEGSGYVTNHYGIINAVPNVTFLSNTTIKFDFSDCSNTGGGTIYYEVIEYY